MKKHKKIIYILLFTIALVIIISLFRVDGFIRISNHRLLKGENRTRVTYLSKLHESVAFYVQEYQVIPSLYDACLCYLKSKENSASIVMPDKQSIDIRDFEGNREKFNIVAEYRVIKFSSHLWGLVELSEGRLGKYHLLMNQDQKVYILDTIPQNDSDWSNWSNMRELSDRDILKPFAIHPSTAKMTGNP